jgi:hypothetical protein
MPRHELLTTTIRCLNQIVKSVTNIQQFNKLLCNPIIPNCHFSIFQKKMRIAHLRRSGLCSGAAAASRWSAGTGSPAAEQRRAPAGRRGAASRSRAVADRRLAKPAPRRPPASGRRSPKTARAAPCGALAGRRRRRSPDSGPGVRLGLPSRGRGAPGSRAPGVLAPCAGWHWQGVSVSVEDGLAGRPGWEGGGGFLGPIRKWAFGSAWGYEKKSFSWAFLCFWIKYVSVFSFFYVYT